MKSHHFQNIVVFHRAAVAAKNDPGLSVVAERIAINGVITSRCRCDIDAVHRTVVDSIAENFYPLRVVNGDACTGSGLLDIQSVNGDIATVYCDTAAQFGGIGGFGTDRDFVDGVAAVIDSHCSKIVSAPDD